MRSMIEALHDCWCQMKGKVHSYNLILPHTLIFRFQWSCNIENRPLRFFLIHLVGTYL
jgi:hypothetical protein